MAGMSSSLGEVADDLDALEAGIRRAMAVADRPSLLILRSHIGYPSPDFTDNHEAHGNPFKAEHVTRTKAVMGIPDEPFWAPSDVVDGVPDRFAQLVDRRPAGGLGKPGSLQLAPTDRAEWDARWAHRHAARLGCRAADLCRRANRSPPASPFKR